jgi:Domain of unknown function (DUF1707)
VGDPNMRVGDAERNEVAEALSQHFSAGRLDDAELKERLDRAMGAKTWADLSGLLDDLPPLGESVVAPPSPRRHRVATWALVVLAVLVVFSGPWHQIPWFWYPRVPWILAGLVILALWRRSRARHWHAGRTP